MFLRDITNIHNSPTRQVRSGFPCFVAITFRVSLGQCHAHEAPLTHRFPRPHQIHVVNEFPPQRIAPYQQVVVSSICVQ